MKLTMRVSIKVKVSIKVRPLMRPLILASETPEALRQVWEDQGTNVKVVLVTRRASSETAEFLIVVL
jgi:hypothetical protein